MSSRSTSDGEGGVDGALLVDERPHRTAVEPSTLDRRGLDHSAFAHRERIDAGRKERLDRRRSPNPRVVGAHRDELFEEERVPLRRVHHLVAPDLRPPPGRQAAEQAGRVGVGERLEPDDAALPARGGPRRPPLEQVAARDADDQHGPGRLRRDVLDEVEHRRARPSGCRRRRRRAGRGARAPRRAGARPTGRPPRSHSPRPVPLPPRRATPPPAAGSRPRGGLRSRPRRWPPPGRSRSRSAASR